MSYFLITLFYFRYSTLSAFSKTGAAEDLYTEQNREISKKGTWSTSEILSFDSQDTIQNAQPNLLPLYYFSVSVRAVSEVSFVASEQPLANQTEINKTR